MLRFLLDENLPPLYRRELLRRSPELNVWRVGDPGAPPTSTPDPVILEWCEAFSFVLVTANRHSMPGHLREHLARGRHVPGILVIRRRASIGSVIEDLIVFAEAGDDQDVRDQIVHIPVR